MICYLVKINWRKISTITSSVTPLFILQMTVLHLAAEFKCSAEIVNILIEAGADVHAVNGYQSSPLHFEHILNPSPCLPSQRPPSATPLKKLMIKAQGPELSTVCPMPCPRQSL